MKGRQIEYMKCVAGLYGKALDAVQGKLVRYKDIRLVWKSHLAQPGLDCYLPAAGGAEIHIVASIRDDVTDVLRQLRIIDEPP